MPVLSMWREIRIKPVPLVCRSDTDKMSVNRLFPPVKSVGWLRNLAVDKAYKSGKIGFMWQQRRNAENFERLSCLSCQIEDRWRMH